jgi:hypothetical protein
MQRVAASDTVFVTVLVTHNSFVSNDNLTNALTHIISDSAISTTQGDAYINASCKHTHIYIYIFPVFIPLKVAQYEPKHVEVTVSVENVYARYLGGF